MLKPDCVVVTGQVLVICIRSQKKPHCHRLNTPLVYSLLFLVMEEHV